MSPLARRVIRYSLMSFGASFMISAGVNVYTGSRTPDFPELLNEFGIAPAEFAAPMIGFAVIGAGLFAFGFFWWRKG